MLTGLISKDEKPFFAWQSCLTHSEEKQSEGRAIIPKRAEAGTPREKEQQEFGFFDFSVNVSTWARHRDGGVEPKGRDPS